MGSIIVAMPRLEDAEKISKMLKSRGIEKIDIYTTGASVSNGFSPLPAGFTPGIYHFCIYILIVHNVITPCD